MERRNRSMTVMLYKNTQTEGEKVYKDLWQLSSYEPETLFSVGFTAEQAEYIIPDSFKIVKSDGKDYLQKENYLYEIFTNPAGKPGIRIINGGVFCNELRKPGEEPKEEPKPERKSNAWVPQMIDGEWEIY
jgi:hypothetical protein